MFDPIFEYPLLFVHKQTENLVDIHFVIFILCAMGILKLYHDVDICNKDPMYPSKFLSSCNTFSGDIATKVDLSFLLGFLGGIWACPSFNS